MPHCRPAGRDDRPGPGASGSRQRLEEAETRRVHVVQVVHGQQGRDRDGPFQQLAHRGVQGGVAEAREAEQTHQAWLARYFPAHVRAGFAPHHHAFWGWVWAIGSSSTFR